MGVECVSTSLTSPSADAHVRFVVGRIGKPHGVRGDVSVVPRTDEPERRFADDATLMVAGQDRTLQVAHSAWHAGRLRVHFRGVDSREQAEALRGIVLEVERESDEVPEDPDEFYDSALVGCTAVLPDGSTAGRITAVVHLPAQDVLAVTDDTGREFLVPFVREIVPRLDLQARLIVIDPPPGLMEADS